MVLAACICRGLTSPGAPGCPADSSRLAIAWRVAATSRRRNARVLRFGFEHRAGIVEIGECPGHLVSQVGDMQRAVLARGALHLAGQPAEIRSISWISVGVSEWDGVSGAGRSPGGDPSPAASASRARMLLARTWAYWMYGAACPLKSRALSQSKVTILVLSRASMGYFNAPNPTARATACFWLSSSVGVLLLHHLAAPAGWLRGSGLPAAPPCLRARPSPRCPAG